MPGQKQQQNIIPMGTKTPCNLVIGALNFHGITDKLDDPSVIELISKCDIFSASETWLGENDAIKVPGYKFFPIHRKNNKGPQKGGIGVFVKESIRKYVKIRYDLSCENVLWCRLTKKYFGFKDDIFLGSVYFPPENSTREKRLKNEHFKDLKEICSKIKENKILIGDFNARTNGLDDTMLREKHDDIIIHDFYSKIKTKRNNQDKGVNNYG